jgi:hypothetical protein
MKYENVRGVFGLCQRNSQVRNNQELVNIIKEKGLGNLSFSQYDDEDSDYIWCVFYEGELGDEIENIVNYIMDYDEERFW